MLLSPPLPRANIAIHPHGKDPSPITLPTQIQTSRHRLKSPSVFPRLSDQRALLMCAGKCINELPHGTHNDNLVQLVVGYVLAAILENPQS